MSGSRRANTAVLVLAVLILGLGFLGYRFSQYGQATAPGPGQPAQVDQKPPDASYKPRPG